MVPPAIGAVTGTGGVESPYGSNNGLAIDDTTIVLGNTGAACYLGTASIWVWDGVSSWQRQLLLDDPDGVLGGTNQFDCFGGSVAVKGNLAFVGSPAANSFEGEVFPYTRSGTTWTQGSRIADSTLKTFGWAMAFDGTHLAVGAPESISSTATYVGRVEIMTQGGAGGWNEQKLLSGPVPTGSACFGSALAFGGSRLVVGASGAPSNVYTSNATIPGLAYSYLVSGTTWTYEASAQGNDTTAGDGFGHAVAVVSTGSPDPMMVVGAPAATGIAANTGAVYTFYYDSVNGTWLQNAKIYDPSGASGDLFGDSVVAISTTRIAVGAAGVNKVYLYDWAGSATWNLTIVYTGCPENIGLHMASWSSLVVTGKQNAVVIDTSQANTDGGCGGN